MFLRARIALLTLTSAVVQAQSCEKARTVSSAQMSEEGQAAGALNEKPACQRIRMPDLKNVFVAQVLRVEDHDGELNVDGKCVKTLLQTVHLRVKEQLVGRVGSEVTVSSGDLNGFYFKTGEVDLVYAELSKDGGLYVSGYGQTKPIARAADDLAYLRSYEHRASGGEIFGRAFAAANARVASQMVPWPVKPMKGLHVTLQSDLHYEAVVGSDGRYKVRDLPSGRYVVIIDEKSAVWPASSQTVEVADKGCAEVSFSVDPFHTQDGALIKPEP